MKIFRGFTHSPTLLYHSCIILRGPWIICEMISWNLPLNFMARSPCLRNIEWLSVNALMRRGISDLSTLMQGICYQFTGHSIFLPVKILDILYLYSLLAKRVLLLPLAPYNRLFFSKCASSMTCIVSSLLKVDSPLFSNRKGSLCSPAIVVVECNFLKNSLYGAIFDSFRSSVLLQS